MIYQSLWIIVLLSNFGDNKIHCCVFINPLSASVALYRNQSIVWLLYEGNTGTEWVK